MEPSSPPHDPPVAQSGTPARSRVVVGLDGSASDEGTLSYAFAAAARRGAALDAVTVLPTDLSWAATTFALDTPTEEDTRAEVARHTALLMEDVQRDLAPAATAAVPVRIRVLSGHPAAVLIGESEQADLLVVGRRGRSPVRSALLGSVALHCATHARCPVVVVHPGAAGPAASPRVVAGVDGSTCSGEALRLAVEEATRTGGDVEATIAYSSVDYGPDLYRAGLPSAAELLAGAEKTARRQVDQVTAELARAARTGGAPPTVRVAAVEGAAADVLVERSHDAALLVVGSHGHGRFRGLLLGSVALHCAIFATCPVMIVRSDPAAQRTGQ